ncbi:MAG: 5-formyltetrahydrofolate cyclo-ligase [Planctomycetota bacterium]
MIAEFKKKLRVQSRAAIEAVIDDGPALSAAMVEHLVRSDVWAGLGDRVVVAFLPLRDEPDVRGLWSRAGMPDLAVPRIDWDTKRLEPALVRSLESDVEATRGVPHPTAGCPVVELDRVGLVLVPGLAFDRAGRRLGRGAGFYDRFLEGLGPEVVACGVSFEVQMVEEVPTEDHDARVRMILTESGLRDAR